MKKNTPGCATNDCCDPCESCSVVTFFTIAGISDPSTCDGGCTKYNGTYVFRTIGSLIAACMWQILLAADNCNLDDEPGIYIGVLPSVVGGCGGSGIYAYIFFAAEPGGGVRATVQLDIHYRFQFNSTVPPTYDSRRYIYTFSRVFASCADAVGQTLPWVSTTKTVCAGSDTGDFCGIESATVTLG